MKKVKLFCGILIGLFIFTNCSNSDDSNINSNSIIGTWKPIKDVNICSTGSEEIIDYSSCLQMSRTTYNSDGTFNSKEYSDETGNCKEFSYSGTWKIEGKKLILIINGETNVPNYFELTKNTLRIGFYDSILQNDQCGNGKLTNSYAEFIKVN